MSWKCQNKFNLAEAESISAFLRTVEINKNKNKNHKIKALVQALTQGLEHDGRRLVLRPKVLEAEVQGMESRRMRALARSCMPKANRQWA